MTSNKAVIYARVSSKEQEETGYSLPSQEKLLQEYAQRRGFEVVKVFAVAESASGAKQRQVFAEMMEYLRKHNIPHLLCEKVDRLTRNLKEAVVVNDWVEENGACKIHFVKQNLVIHKEAKSDEKFRWDIEIVLAKKFISNLSEEVRKGQAEKIRQGWYPCRAPLGYKTVGEKGHKTHVVDPEKGPFIRRAFELYATGNYSLAALRDLLYKEGLRTHNGARLSKSRLADIFADPFYYGAMRWNDTVHKALHEPLATKELWDRVQDILQGKTAPHYKRREFQFSKRMNCGECGGTISGEIQKGHIYYSCKHGKKCSQQGTTREEAIESQLMGVFAFFEKMTPAEAEEIYSRIRKNHQAEAEYKENTLKALNTRYVALQRQLDILYDDRLAEKISQERWEAKQKLINDEQASIRGEMERIKNQETKYFELYINILDLARRAAKIYAKRTPEQRRILLGHLFSNLTLKDKNVAYELKSPVEKLSKRIQERLDAQKKFEPKKSLINKPGLTSDSKNDSLLEWRDAFRQFDWRKEFSNAEFHLRTLEQLLSLAR